MVMFVYDVDLLHVALHAVMYEVVSVVVFVYDVYFM